jgi:imidazolonepropionase-like amidohydrolase
MMVRFLLTLALVLAGGLAGTLGAGSPSNAARATGDFVASHGAALIQVTQECQTTLLLEHLTQRCRPRTTAFVGVRVVDVTDGSVRDNQTVVVRGGRFTAIGPAATTAVPRGALIIPGRGRWLLPGLTDMHVHSLVSNRQKLLNLINGVTTVRDMDGFPFILHERDAIAAGRLLGPTMFVAGTILNAVPMGDYARVVTTPEEARTAVLEQKRAGYDFIKVHNVMPLDLYTAILEEAHRDRLDVVGHIPHGIPLATALRLGQRTIEHFKGYYRDEDLELTNEDRAGLTRDATVWNCPTFYAGRSGIARAELDSLVANSDEMRYVPHADLQRWRAEAGDQPDASSIKIRTMCEQIFRELRAVHARFLTGTDSGGGYTAHVPGFSLRHELEILQSLGMSPIEALQASTIEPAAAMRRESEFGSISPGLRADALLLSENPLAGVEHLTALDGVMARGAWLGAETLDSTRAALAAIDSNNARVGAEDPRRAVESVAHELSVLQRERFPALVGRDACVDSVARMLIDLGDVAGARDLLTRDLDDFPQSAGTRALLAEVLLKTEGPAAARRELARAFDIDPLNSEMRRTWIAIDGGAPPSERTGAMSFDMHVLASGNRMKTLHATLEISRSEPGWSGWLRTGALPDIPLEDIAWAGDRFWATAPFQAGAIRLGLALSRGRAHGAWLADWGGGTIAAAEEAVDRSPPDTSRQSK